MNIKKKYEHKMGFNRGNNDIGVSAQEGLEEREI